MKVHMLKVWPQQYEELASGDKTFEFRKNDRDFQVGDTLHLQEYIPFQDSYTGRTMNRLVKHMLSDGFGLPSGYVVMSLASYPPPPAENVVLAARAFMDLFVIDNGEDRGLSIDDIDMAEFTDRFAALEAALSDTPVPLLVGTWLPIERADKTITDVQSFPEVGMTISMSDRYWVRDEDGRVYEAAWSEGNHGDRDYWWDFEGESPVDPVEFMPHPLDPRFASAEGSDNGR